MAVAIAGGRAAPHPVIRDTNAIGAGMTPFRTPEERYGFKPGTLA